MIFLNGIGNSLNFLKTVLFLTIILREVLDVKCSTDLICEKMDTFCHRPGISGTDFHTSNGENGKSRRSRILALEKDTSPTKIIEELFAKRLFNTTMNFIIPGATMHIPHNTEDGSLIHLAMQAFFGIFWAVTWITTIAIPVVFTYFRPLGLRRSLDDPNGFHLKWKLNERIAEDIGLNWDQCLQKTICQAHASSNHTRYGILGEIIRFLFPFSSHISNVPMSSLYESAKHGTIGHDCGHIYHCFFDVLDVIFYVKNNCFAEFPP